MTPFELSLQNELNVEALRFANEWLFKWYNLNIEGHTVDVDRFDGGRIHLSGIRFEGQPQQIFWQAIRSYMNQKIHETFRHWDAETKVYPDSLRRASIDGVERDIRQFVTKVVSDGVDTDRRLRGRGYPQNVASFNATECLSAANAEIARLAEAHRALLGERVDQQKLGRLPYKQRIENFLSDHRGIMTAIGLLIAVIGLLKYFF